MPRVELRKATDADCEAFAPRLRPADALETWRSSAKSPLEVIQDSVKLSEGRAGALSLDGQLACLYGIVKPDLLGALAIPWLLTSDVVERHPITFFRIAKVVVDLWAEENPVLLQMVDAEYLAAQQFLRKLGFHIYPPVPHGAFGALFCPALRTR